MTRYAPSYALLLLAPLTLWGCDDEVRQGGPDGPDTLETDTQVVVTMDFVRDRPCDGALTAQNITALAEFVGMPQGSNTIHDCQRLVRSDQGTRSFGPLAALYPVDAALNHANTAQFRDWVVAANIVNHDRGDAYTPLDVQPGLNCLLMRHQAGSWQARIEQPPDPERLCQHQGQPFPSNSPALEVATWTGPRSGQFPPRTARWGYDGGASTTPAAGEGNTPTEWHYIGIKCASDWCSVGPNGFTPRTTDLSTIGVDATTASATPGLYDEQYLAVPREEGGSTVYEPGPWGVIYPSRGLPDHGPGDWQQGPRGARAATMYVFDGAGSPYEQKLSLAPASIRPVDLTGELWLHHDPSSQHGTGDPARAWKAHVERPGQTTFEGAVLNVTHTHGPFGGVRWRWHEDDESGWVECQAGCCDYSGRRFF